MDRGLLRQLMGATPKTDEVIEIIEPLYDERIDSLMDILIKRRQELISRDAIGGIVVAMEALGGHAMKDNPRYRFLYFVGGYHDAIKKKEGDPLAWAWLGARFLEDLEGTNHPAIAFYRLNYAFLCFRNAGGEHEARLEGLYEEAQSAAAGLEQAEGYEALGHLHYNWSRFLLKKGRKSEAFTAWQEAAWNRVGFYKASKESGGGQDALLAAAQQVAKMRCDFRGDAFFPHIDTDRCGVSAELYAELERDFGGKLTAFSAAK